MKKVFLGGTCNQSLWRDNLIPKLEIDYFNPVVSDWNEAAKQRELDERANCDFCLYVITAKIAGVFSIAEVADDSNKRPMKTVFCFSDFDGIFDKKMLKSLQAVGSMVEKNGGTWCQNLSEVGEFLNQSKSIINNH